MDWIDTSNNWEKRKEIVLKEVFVSFDELIKLSKSDLRKSLATIKPEEIIDFEYEKTEKEWKLSWQALWGQLDLFEEIEPELIIKKVPYKFFYKFKTKDEKIRRIGIEDWEIGALYWNCFKKTGNEEEAIKLVRKKYFNDFVQNKDLYFFVGTNYEWHMRKAKNPFMIIGLFYPPIIKEKEQLELQF